MKIWPKLWKFDQNYGNLIKKNRLRDHGNLTKNYENLTKIMLIWSKLLKFDQIIRFMSLIPFRVHKTNAADQNVQW